MKFLQIGDLHLGKRLHEFSLYDDQVFMLEKIIEVLKGDSYDGLLITGDIYDTSTHPQAALNLFGSFLEKVQILFPELAVFIISGNHDSAVRLAYASEIFKKQNIFIQSKFDDKTEPVILKKGSETCAIFMLPFLQHSILKKKNSSGVLEQVEIMSEAVEILRKKIKPNMPNILLAHLLTFPPGKKILSSDGKEIAYWGTAQVIPAAMFDFFDYVALGHIHSMMKITDRMYYSGSPFAYSFNDAKKGSYKKHALSVEINCKEKNSLPVVRPIEISQLHMLKILSGTFSDFIATDKFNQHANDYLTIELIDSNVVQSPMQLLQEKFPLLMHVEQKSLQEFIFNKNENIEIKNLTEKDFEVIYKLFINDIEATTDPDEILLAKKIWESESEEI